MDGSTASIFSDICCYLRSSHVSYSDKVTRIARQQVMDALQCRLENGQLQFTMATLPLDGENVSQSLKDIRDKQGPVVLCVGDGTPDEISSRAPSLLELVSRDTHVKRSDRLSRPSIQLFDLSGMNIPEDAQKQSKCMGNTIRDLLNKAATMERKVLVILFVGPTHYTRMVSRVRSPQSHGARHDNGVTAPEPVGGDMPENSVDRTHPHSYAGTVLERYDLDSISGYGFRGKKLPYGGPHVGQGWGSFFVNLEKAENGRYPSYRSSCPLCTGMQGNTAETLLPRFSYEDESYLVMKEKDPIVTDQIVIISLRSDAMHAHTPGPDYSIHATDVRLIRHLTCEGLRGLTVTHKGDGGGWDTLWKGKFGVYINAFPSEGCLHAGHVHIHCVPADLLPLPSWTSVPWIVSNGTNGSTRISRVSRVPFYALCIRGRGDQTMDKTIVEVYRQLHEQENLPCNLLAYPVSDSNDTCRADFVIVPRAHEFSKEIGRKLTGLEFLTGVCFPGRDLVAEMDPTVRDRAFSSVTLGASRALSLERVLRNLFGLPPFGLAIHAHINGNTRVAKVSNNRMVTDGVIKTGEEYWCGLPQTAPREEHTPDVLVHIRRAGISSLDRRDVASVKPGAFILGREAGGNVIDPGPHGELYAGMKVALIPRIICDACHYCINMYGNLCRTAQRVGTHFDGGLGQLVALPRAGVFPVGDDFPTDALPLVDGLSAVLHALFRVKECFNHTNPERIRSVPAIHPVTVFGAGPMGCLIALALQRFWSHIPVTLIDPRKVRRDFAERNGIGVHVHEQFPENERSRVSFVTSDTFLAHENAITSVSDGGIIVLFSGLSSSEVDKRNQQGNIRGSELQTIHMTEETREHTIIAQNSYTLLGTVGYNNDDVVRAVQELRQHYTDHYRKIQTVIIRGLGAKRGKRPGTMHEYLPPRSEQSAVEALLSPEGILDRENGSYIAGAQKVLIIP
jgi:threonine dehydrogenase-like Zn-dependent dehydrogenase